MNMSWIDWLIIVVIYLGLVVVGVSSRKYMKGVSGFLVAGRGMGKYLGYATGNASDVGAISIVASMEAAYKGGPKIRLRIGAAFFKLAIKPIFYFWIFLLAEYLSSSRNTNPVPDPTSSILRLSKSMFSFLKRLINSRSLC